MKKTLRAFSKKMVLLSAAFVLAFNSLAVAVPSLLTQEASADAASAVVYDALPSVSTPTNYPSVGYEATSTSEFGDYVHLGGTNRKLSTVTITMSDWAKYADYADNPTYSGNTSNWSLPVTLNVYSNAVDANGVPTTKLADVTQNITVPWRPASDYSYNGIAFNAAFDLSSKNVTLPDDIIVGVAFNTQSHGYSPTGQPGPYNSLNVAVPSGQSVSVGSDNSSDEVLLDSTWSGAYGVAGSTGVFRKDTGWSPYGTVAMQITATAPLTIAACSTTSTVHSTSLIGGGWNMAETRSTGHNELLANGLHVWTEGATSTDKAAGYHPVSFNLADLGEGFGLDATATSGSIPPALQLTVDLDGDGAPEGNLVAEPTFYGADTLWLSSNWTGLDLSSAPTAFNGGGTGKGGTVNTWLSAFPNAKVMAIGYSLGSGVLGDYNVTKITANCTDYTFGLAAPTNLTPADDTVTNDPAFADTWSVVEGAHGYAYRTANTMNGSDLGPVIYSDSTTSQPGRYSMSGSTVTRHNSGTPEGTYYWQVSAVDSTGQTGPWSVISKVTVDMTAPGVPIHQTPANNAFINYNDFWFDWNDVSGAVSYEMQNSTNPAVDSNGSFQNVMWTGDYQHIQPTESKAHSVGANGTWYWQVRAVDAAGNRSAWTTPWKVTIDMTAPAAPVIQTPSPEQFFKTQPILDKWSPVTDSSGIEKYQVEYIYDDGHTFVGGPYRDVFGSTQRNHSPSLGEQGGVTIRVRAIDNAGNEGAWSNPVHYTYDATAPSGTIASSAAVMNNSGTITMTGTDMFGIKKISFVTDGEGSGKPYKVWNINLTDKPTSVTRTVHLDELSNGMYADGVHTIKASVEDMAGNIKVLPLLTFTVDNTAPTLTVDAITSSSNTTPTITGTTSEFGGNVTITLDDVEQGMVTSNASGNWSWTPSTPLTLGSHTIVATATDAVGNSSAASTSTDQPYWKQFSITAPAPTTEPAQETTTPQAAPTPAPQALTVVTNNGGVDGTADDTAVLGEQSSATSDKSTDTSSDQAVAGASDTKSTEWNLFGIAWYWLLLALAVLAAIWWYIAARRNKDE